jgi:uncharacterized protein (TIGR02117 family)
MVKRRARAWRVAAMAPLLIAILLIGGSILPRNQGWRAPPAGVTIFVESNGVHTGLILPAGALTGIVAPDAFAPLPPPRWLSVGWGQADFYRGTPTWADVDPLLVLRAMAGSDRVVLHVEWRDPPRPDRWRRAVRLDPASYARLVASVRRWFATPAHPTPGYGPDSRFYPARGRYSAVASCNNWTADRLAEAGVVAPLWAPLAGGVTRWYPAR